MVACLMRKDAIQRDHQLFGRTPCDLIGANEARELKIDAAINSFAFMVLNAVLVAKLFKPRHRLQ
jgi:hypothetical protein